MIIMLFVSVLIQSGGEGVGAVRLSVDALVLASLARVLPGGRVDGSGGLGADGSGGGSGGLGTLSVGANS